MANTGGAGKNYKLARAGRVFFSTTNPDAVAPDLFGALGFEAMTPLLVARNPSTSSRVCTIESASIILTGAPASYANLRAMVDPVDRYVTSSGIQHTPGWGNPRANLTDSTRSPAYTPVLEVYDEEPDLEAAGFTDSAGNVSVAMEVDYGALPSGVGNIGEFDLGNSVVLEPGAIFMIYGWDTAGSSRYRWSLRWSEEVVQA